MHNQFLEDINILVVGDLMLDHYLWGQCDRISPEAPVQIVDVKEETTVLGGAGNVINNLKALGVNVSVMSVIGTDMVAHELTARLDDINVEHFLIKQEKRKTSKKSRVMAARAQVVRYDNETRDDINTQSEEYLIKVFDENVQNYDLVLLSDYGKGVLTENVCKTIIKNANDHDKKVLVDPKGTNYTKYQNAYLLTPNKKEASIATGIDIRDEKSLIKALQSLKKMASLQISMITLSQDGIAIFDNELIKLPTIAKEVYDVTGAGDTVLASLGFCLAQDIDIQQAVEFANFAAGVVVGKLGSATATLEEIEEYKSSLHKGSIDSHIKSWDEIEYQVEKFKIQNKKIVFTNGCFDILHRGHVFYLDKAKSFGDVLILGLNSDHSVKRLKGENRPINTQEDRAFVLAALESVDYVVMFDGDTPYDLISLIQPDILVKGGDYEGKEIVGCDIAHETRLINFVDGKSTTSIIERIQRQEDD